MFYLEIKIIRMVVLCRLVQNKNISTLCCVDHGANRSLDQNSKREINK
jgi:hypothetical protein